jgi:hypothetical protein
MDPFTTDSQIEDLMEFGFYDDEETKHEIEEYYDDLAVGLPLDSNHDF